MLPDFRPGSLSASARPARGGVFRTNLDRRMLNQRVVGAVLIATLIAALYHQNDPFERLALPAMSILMGALLATLSLTRVPLLTTQIAGLTIGWAYLLAKVAYILFAQGDAGLPMLLNLAPWGGVLLASHLWTLGPQASAPLNVAALGSLAALLAAKVALEPASAQSDVTGSVLQMLLAGGVLLAGQRSAAQRMTGDVRRAVLGQDTPGLDALTGLPDRITLERQLEGAYRQSPEHLVVAAIAVDLQPTPDGAGPNFQVRLSAHVSRVLMSTVRDQDLLGCLDDGVAALVMRAPDARSARAACERLRVRVASRPLDGVNPTVTIGLVYADGLMDAPDLLRAAEDTLSAARRTGPNRVLLGPVTPDPGGNSANVDALFA
ncbi:diguanylate cyclase domain-containing protein [Deinococcus sp. JMULE3]|uniref:diguanylate cyclase domain-containing protein n=1 Tax=Deinococcus sp. JMULE3 TaxID=2518341 RepID=UPI001575ED90|nr:diguanylate cyclase [Deinococcus sp. JMULE3]NTY00389.1 diguanylate cyclase [Deinococcus sp. JMULE3]